MVGHDLSESHTGRREAEKRVRDSRLIFSTCIGAGLGLLRPERFDIVLVDEASQQTEPQTLTPLVKGCRRAILVGDHVQLRATVQKHALLSEFDVSLFERHYCSAQTSEEAKVMLDIQYRMHPDICRFSSKEFYEDKLHTAAKLDERLLPMSSFPWPSNGARKVFVACDSTEDLGNQSKANHGQVQACQVVYKLLTSRPAVNHGSDEIAILTPYARQREHLKTALPSAIVSSIDGFQGREADIVIFVTVRCNLRRDIGFLKDLRRLNVVMTRARAGIIIIGSRSTLTEMSDDEGVDDASSKQVWQRLLSQCMEVALQHTTTRTP